MRLTINRRIYVGMALLLCGCYCLTGKRAWGQELAGCATRHFYNNSKVEFEIALGSGSCSIGKYDQVSRCVVPSGQTADLHYANIHLAPSQDPEGKDTIQIKVPSEGITVKSRDGGKTYRETHFSVSVAPTECYIHHDGNTGNIVVNSAADGDIATCGPLHRDWKSNGGYDCR